MRHLVITIKKQRAYKYLGIWIVMRSSIHMGPRTAAAPKHSQYDSVCYTGPWVLEWAKEQEVD